MISLDNYVSKILHQRVRRRIAYYALMNRLVYNILHQKVANVSLRYANISKKATDRSDRAVSDSAFLVIINLVIFQLDTIELLL